MDIFESSGPHGDPRAGVRLWYEGSVDGDETAAAQRLCEWSQNWSSQGGDLRGTLMDLAEGNAEQQQRWTEVGTRVVGKVADAVMVRLNASPHYLSDRRPPNYLLSAFWTP